MTTRSLLTLGILLLSTGCPDRFDVDDNPGATTGGDATTTVGCDLGQAGCTCLEGLCAPGLVCQLELCVELGGGSGDASASGPLPGTDDGASGDSSTGDEGGTPGSCVGHCGDAVPDVDGGLCFCAPSCGDQQPCCTDYEEVCAAEPDECEANADCGPQEVCSSSTRDCVVAFGHTYDVRLHFVDDPSSVSDVFFRLWYGNAPTTTSVVSNVNEAWTDVIPIAIQESVPMAAEALHWDGATATQLIGGCFGTPCGGVLIEYLKEGGGTWTLGPRKLEIYFTPR